jgi:peptidylprolyl isomerase
MPKKGDLVVVHYRVALQSGKEVDSSEGHEPLQFVLGDGSMIRGFEKEVGPMKVGETKTVTIKAADAYGPVRKDMILEVTKENLPPGLSPKVGDKLQVRNTQVKVVKVTDNSITVDANHELAGQDLVFTIKLIAVRK